MNQLSGAPEAPTTKRRRGTAKKPFALDIETVPHRKFWHGGEAYEIDHYWEERRLHRWAVEGKMPNHGPQLEGERHDARLKGEAPMRSTGQIPACHPTTAHVVSCSFARIDEAEKIQIETVQLNDFCDFEDDPEKSIKSVSTDSLKHAESKVVRRAFQLLEWATQNGRTIVTFNGKPFDLPMLRWRATLLGQEIPKFNWYEMLYPYRHKEHIDLRLLFSDGDKRAHGTLAMWCEAYGIEAEESGDEVFDWCLRGKWDDLRRYGGRDAANTLRLFQAIEGAL
ncbi:MAG: hypothetical protein V3R16_09570 [Nitrospirales bacterium]